MQALYLKEIKSFLNSLIGYVVIGVFLILVGLFLWVFPGDFNILDLGFANIDGLFVIAPWVFMFLIPAITMRSFAEEKRNGTMELLFTKPISDFEIVLSKYLAGFTLVVIALLPTLLYFISVWNLGSPAGNIDVGGTFGSYIGLLFLAAGYLAIGLFSSAITNNQIVAFLLGVVFCFFIYTGFESLGSFQWFGALDDYIIKLGIAHHFNAMSRGLIDTRDVLYFFGLSGVFLLATKLVLSSRNW